MPSLHTGSIICLCSQHWQLEVSTITSAAAYVDTCVLCIITCLLARSTQPQVEGDTPTGGLLNALVG